MSCLLSATDDRLSIRCSRWPAADQARCTCDAMRRSKGTHGCAGCEACACRTSVSWGLRSGWRRPRGMVGCECVCVCPWQTLTCLLETDPFDTYEQPLRSRVILNLKRMAKQSGRLRSIRWNGGNRREWPEWHWPSPFKASETVAPGNTPATREVHSFSYCMSRVIVNVEIFPSRAVRPVLPEA